MQEMTDVSPGRGTIADRVASRRLIWFGLAWLAAAALLWFFLKDVPLLESWLVIRGIQVWKIAVLVGANLLVLLLFGLRWWLILRIFGQRVPFLAVFGYRIAGFGVGYFTPGPQIGGEPVQVLLLGRHHVPPATAVASVFFDKLLELLANFLFLVLGLLTALLSGMVHQEVSVSVWIVLPLVILLPVVHLWMLSRGNLPLTHLVEKISFTIPWKVLARSVQFISHGEELIGDFLRNRPSALAAVIFISGFVWIVSVIEFRLMLIFLGSQASWVQTIGILTAGRIAFLLPMPGGMGTLEAGLVFASQAAGLTAAVGLAAGLVIHFRDILISFVGLWIAGWSSQSTIDR